MQFIKISIVLPVYNSVNFIEETLISIFNQEYPNLELIVLDSCSTDGTTEVLKKYSSKIDQLIIEKDNGQYYAVKKGLEIASGEVIAWINADDKYFPWTFSFVNKIFSSYNDVNWISGIPSYMNDQGEIYGMNNTIPTRPTNFIKNGWFRNKLFGYLQQEGMFWRKTVYDEIDGIDINYKLAADFDLWTRMANNAELISVGISLAIFRVHQNSRSKVFIQEYENEVSRIVSLKQKAPFIYRVLFKIHPYLNAVLRKMIWKKSKIYYFSLKDRKWKLDNKLTSISQHPISHIMLK